MEERRNDGGPAFPVPAIYDPSREQVNSTLAYTGEGGMTLRDYFMAHAPAEPQPWFEPVTPIYESQEQTKKVRARERYLGWPAAWADEMLKRRAG
jgi:hypothetical protein